MTPEGKVKAAVKKWLQARGWWYYMPVQNGMGVTGIPDFICCQPVVITQDMVGQTIGVFRAIETKAEGRRSQVSANQQNVMAKIHQAGGSAIVCDNVAQLDDAPGWTC